MARAELNPQSSTLSGMRAWLGRRASECLATKTSVQPKISANIDDCCLVPGSLPGIGHD